MLDTSPDALSFFVLFQMMKFKVQGLVADLMPNIRMMQASGHFMFNYYADNSGALHSMRLSYSVMHLVLVIIQYG